MSDFDAVFFFRLLILMQFFSLDSLLMYMYLSVVWKRIWHSSNRFWDIRGRKGPTPKIVTFFILSQILIYFFKNLFLLMSTKRICKNILAIGIHCGIKRGQRGQKRYFYWICKFLSSYPILMGFFSLDSSLKELLVVCLPIWCSSLRFWDIRGGKGLMPKIVTFLIYCDHENHCVQQITVSKTLVCQAP